MARRSENFQKTISLINEALITLLEINKLEISKKDAAWFEAQLNLAAGHLRKSKERVRSLLDQAIESYRKKDDDAS